jgi:septal ring factor EnvC (AmiA/AmiB activator)
MEELNTEVKNTEVKKAKNNTNKNSIIFLVVVLLSTIAMAIYNNSLQKDIEKLKNNISLIETSIKEVESDKKLQIYSLLELNSSVIKSYKSMNNITRYINHMNVIQAKYDLLFK